MSNTQATTRSWSQPVAELWQSAKIRTVLQILFLLGMGALAALAKKADLSLGIPGSNAPLWLGALVAGRALVRRDGAGALMGASVAVWGLPMGINNAFTYNLALYGVAGLVLDIMARMPKISITNPIGAMASGAAAHMVKFGFIFAAAYTASVTKHFLVVGLVQSAGLHLLFGVVAGFVGWSAWRVTFGRRKAPEDAGTNGD